jgi:glycosyltransferase involved in cell wall biosynthesis
VTNTTGASEVVARAGCGLVCEREPAELRSALLRLWRDDALRAAMGQAGERYVRAHLSWQAVARQMQACYESALVP